MKPSFFIAGPPKCASSSLYFYLNQHPEIQMSSEKETRFFSRDYDKGLDFYISSYFPEIEGVKVAGEATPSYSFLPYAADRIKEHYPQAKFIFSFRHPVERAYSGWLMRSENGSETLGFLEALEANLKQEINFGTAELEKEWVREHMEWKHKRGEIIRTYLEASDYATILENYESRFGKEAIHVVYTSELRKQLLPSLVKIYDFLGIDNQFVIPEQKEQNKYRKARFSGLMFLLNNPRVKNISKYLPGGFKNVAAAGLTKSGNKPTMTPKERSAACKLFEHQVTAFESKTGKDFGLWKV